MAERKRDLTTWASLLLLAVAPFLLAAQEAEEEPDSVSLNFTVLRIGKADFSGVKVEDANGDVIELNFKRIQRSDPVEYAGVNPITFFREIPAPTLDDPNAVQRIPVAQYLAPPELDEALLFFRPARGGDKTSLEFEIVGMDDSLRAFPKDSVIVINAADVPLFGRLGDANVKLVSGANPAISFRNYLNGEFPVGFAVQTEDGPKLIFENQLEFEEDYRIILLLAPPRREGSIRLNVYSIPQLLRERQPAIAASDAG